MLLHSKSVYPNKDPVSKSKYLTWKIWSSASVCICLKHKEMRREKGHRKFHKLLAHKLLFILFLL